MHEEKSPAWRYWKEEILPLRDSLDDMACRPALEAGSGALQHFSAGGGRLSGDDKDSW